jgi:protein-S-isoprenylcysteine O-methyltransferase Ste14
MALFIYCLIYFLLAFVWRSVLVYRRTGHNPFVLAGGDDAHGYVGRAFKGVVLAIAVVVSSHAFFPAASQGWVPLPGLQSPALAYSGWALLWISLAWLLVAQYQMGVSWRIGIDNKVATPLVETGLFKRSRNPIFLGMRLNLLGLFLVLPNTATACIAVAGEVVIQVQVRLEEAFLAARHGDAYRAYQGRVRRWL